MDLFDAAVLKKRLDILLNELFGFVLDLITAVVCDHIPLIRQVEFLLVPDGGPATLNEDWHAIHGHVLLLGVGQEQRVSRTNFKSITQLLRLFNEPLLFENFVRHHMEVELKELLRLGVFKVVRLVDLLPDALDIVLKDDLDSVAIVATIIEVTQDKQQALRCLLIEELQIDLKDDFEQSVVAGSISAYVVGPHVDKEDICHCKGKQ